jgi:hypothetical protein
MVVDPSGEIAQCIELHDVAAKKPERPAGPITQ